MYFEILLSSYNGEKYIGKQIESILNQTFKNWNLSIADDLSIDRTPSIIKKYCDLDKRIKFKKNNKRLGALISFYNLLIKSNGEYVVFCDQDDIWLPDKLESIFNFIKRKNNNVIFGIHNGEYLFSSRDNKNYFIKKTIYESKPNLSFLRLFSQNQIIGCMTFGKSSSLKKIIPKTPPSDSGLYLDYWISLNVSIKYKIDFLDKKLIKYRRHENTATKKNRSFLEKIKTRFIIVIFLLFNRA